jgi:hypothetical protein
LISHRSYDSTPGPVGLRDAEIFNVFTFLLFEIFTMMLRGVAEYFFAYGMWDLQGAPQIFISRTLPVALYSAAAGIPLFFLARFLHRRFPVSDGDGA